MNRSEIYKNFKEYLQSRNWYLNTSNSKYDIFIPDSGLDIEKDFRLYIPNQIDKSDFVRNIERLLDIVSNLHDEKSDDLSEIIIDSKQILKLHIFNDNIKDGKPPLKDFEKYISKIRNMLYETASFTVKQKQHIFEKDVEEAERYINYCRFIKNDEGSLITKVELPNEEEIQIENLFSEPIKGYDINNKFFDVIEFINSRILKEEYMEPSDEELIMNKGFISVNVTEKLHDFYDSIELNDVDFELKRLNHYALKVHRF